MPLGWGNLVITEPGTYTRTGFTNIYGCDSSITMYFTVRPSSNTVTNLTICETQLPYTWNGLVFTAADTQTATGFTNISSCDSSATLNLSVIPATSVTNITICPLQLPYTWNGLTFTAAGTQTATGFTNINGCDSSATLVLTVNSNVTGTDVQAACGSYTWIDGNTYSANNNTATYTLTGSSGCDSVVTLNLTINNPTTGTDVQTACGSYTWIDGNTYTANNNTATYTLSGSSGCDSVVTLNLQITEINTQATTSGAVCTATETGAEYQWIDCSNNQSLAGANAQSFTASQNGSYACIVSKGSCTDTTTCVNVITIGVNDISPYFFKVYPNPTAGSFLIEHNYGARAKIEIVDALGQTVQQFDLQPLTTYLDISQLASGVYSCTIVSSGAQVHKFKLVKQ
jgi:hypothetical protein